MVGFAGDGSIQCEAITRSSQRFHGHTVTGHCACAVQGHDLVPGQRAHRNAISYRRRELLQWATHVQVEPGLLGIFDQRTGPDQGASDAPHEGIEQALELGLRRC